MLSNIMSREYCAGCRFCCSFRKTSLCETPGFPIGVADKYISKGLPFTDDGDFARMELSAKYVSEDINEEAPCHFLNPDKGCILDADEKPFECKIWPLRVLRKDAGLYIAISLSCPFVKETGTDIFKTELSNGLSEKIREFAYANPYIIKDYMDGYQILDEISQADFRRKENGI